MKRYLIILAMGLMITLCQSCQKDLELYSGKASVYFSMFSTGLGLSHPIDSAIVSFAFAPASVEDSLVVLTVNTLGPISNVDRRFKAVVNTKETTAESGIDYEPLAESYLVEAGKNVAELPVKLKRSAALKDNSRRLSISLKESDDFKIAISTMTDRNSNSSAITYRIDYSDVISEPANWITSSFYFGRFSREKLMLMNKLTNVPIQQLVGRMNVASYRYIGSVTKKHLQEMADAGTPVYEADGVTLMEMGSYII